MEHREFEWQGNHAALDFVNTLDERLSPQPEERLSSYAALIEFSRQSHLIDDTAAARLVNVNDQAVWVAGLRLRETLYLVLRAVIDQETPDQGDLLYLETAIRQAAAARQLVAGDSGFQWSWKEPDSPARPLWELTIVIEEVLLSKNFQRIKKCAADDCGVLYLDDSRAGSRRWCSMASCGNRHKVQQFRSSRKKSN